MEQLKHPEKMVFKMIKKNIYKKKKIKIKKLNH